MAVSGDSAAAWVGFVPGVVGFTVAGTVKLRGEG